MQIPIYTLIFAGFPEMIAVALLGFTVSKAKYNWRIVVFTGISLALAAYFIRMIPTITFGIHTIILIAIFFLALIKLGGAEIAAGILGSVSVIVALVVFETVSIMIIMQLFNLTPEIVTENQYLRTLVGWPHILLLFLSSFLINKLRSRRKNAFFSN